MVRRSPNDHAHRYLEVVAGGVGLTAVLVTRVVVALVLVVFRRFRQLVAFLATFVVVDWLVAAALSVPLPAPDVAPVVAPGPFTFPSRPISAIAITVILMAFVLVPRGPARRVLLVVGNLLIAVELAAQLFLATDVPSAMLYSWLLAVVVPPLAFRWGARRGVPGLVPRGGNAAHLDLGGERQIAVTHAMADQLGMEVTKVEPFGLEGSGGSSPLRMTLADGTRVFGKIYSTSHVRADRWYRIGRTILYGQLEDETPIGSVRRLVILEDYALRFLRDAGIRVARSYGIVELTPNAEYMLVTEFFEGVEEPRRLGDRRGRRSTKGWCSIRTLWDIGRRASRHQAREHLGQGRTPAAGRRLGTGDPAVVVAAGGGPREHAADARAPDGRRPRVRTGDRVFTPDEIAEAFASRRRARDADRARVKLKADGRPLRERFKELAPVAAPISIQRWSGRRLALTAIAAIGVLVLAGLFVDALRAGIT